MQLGAQYAKQWRAYGDVPFELRQELEGMISPSIQRNMTVTRRADGATRYAAAVAIPFMTLMGLSIVLGVLNLLGLALGLGSLLDAFPMVSVTLPWLVISYLLYRRATRVEDTVWTPQYEQAYEGLLRAAKYGCDQALREAGAQQRQREREEAVRLRRAWRLTGKEEWDPPVAPPQAGAIAAAGSFAPAKAEEVAAVWLRWLGAGGVAVTQSTRDGGVDVRARILVAQVKWQAQPVAPARVREIFGVAQAEQARAAFFAGPAGYSREAARFADATGVFLFVMDDQTGQLTAVSDSADAALRTGLQR